MPCEFHQERPRPFDDLDAGCQFGGEKEFFRFDAKNYCRFHLPLEDGDGNDSPKRKWDEGEIERFNEAVFAFIKKARDEKRPADLTGVTFPGDVEFSRFSMGPSFPKICFFKAAFARRADFSEAAFVGIAYFCETAFEGIANFREVAFNGDAHFSEAWFSDADFIEAAFRGDADFREAAFSGYADFSEAAFKGHAWFTGSAEYEVTPSNTFRRADFRGAVFRGNADFRNRRFLHWTRFEKATFHVAPEFHNAVLHQDTVFPTEEGFPDTKEDHAARAYRTLKLVMGNVRDRDKEAMFYALEQKSLLRSWNAHIAYKPWSLRYLMSWIAFIADKLWSGLYWLVANYGRSIWLPVVWLVGVTALFAVFYVGIADGTVPAEYLEALDFAIEQIVRPFFVWTQSYHEASTGWVKDVLTRSPYPLKFLASLQSALSLALLTLFILAIRRRFRLN